MAPKLRNKPSKSPKLQKSPKNVQFLLVKVDSSFASEKEALPQQLELNNDCGNDFGSESDLSSDGDSLVKEWNQLGLLRARLGSYHSMSEDPLQKMIKDVSTTITPTHNMDDFRVVTCGSFNFVGEPFESDAFFLCNSCGEQNHNTFENSAKGMIQFRFNTIWVSDAISMGTRGMCYSLQSRDLIGDSSETVMVAQWYDGALQKKLGMHTNCSKKLVSCDGINLIFPRHENDGYSTASSIDSDALNTFHDESNPLEARSLSVELKEAREITGTEVRLKNVEMVSDVCAIEF